MIIKMVYSSAAEYHQQLQPRDVGMLNYNETFIICIGTIARLPAGHGAYFYNYK
ncbi:hypothetical protein JI741_31500 [Chryseolinea sp. Jin1]|uniref:Uncharacterized protein n=1 Tax=Chryseolinea lacunae TaxID=2801331 RepID=A0ABS1L2P8_9BACT|nr:hypothetical protein [Chryseolinea lacunae]